MTSKKDKQQTNINLPNFFRNLGDSDKDMSYEKALSQSIIYAMTKFHDTSETSKWDSKAMAILSLSNPTMKDLCDNIVLHKKDYKRRRSKEWKEIIKSIAKSIHRENVDDNKGLLSFLRR